MSKKTALPTSADIGRIVRLPARSDGVVVTDDRFAPDARWQIIAVTYGYDVVTLGLVDGDPTLHCGAVFSALIPAEDVI